MTVREYNELLDRVSRLAPQEQVNLLADIATLLRDAGVARKRHSIMEFEGLANGLWKDVDVAAYIKRERDSWDG